MSSGLRTNLEPAIRASLKAKLERLLARPVIARVVRTGVEGAAATPRSSVPASGEGDGGEEALDNGWPLRVALDYDDVWREREKEVVEIVSHTVENLVMFLTTEQRSLLERSPREFLALDPQPESAELVAFRTERWGRVQRVVELTVASDIAAHAEIEHVAIVPNVVQIQRQLDALDEVGRAPDDGVLAPLRALLGLSDAPMPSAAREITEQRYPDERLDEHQAGCVAKAMGSPHFAVIHGPPGSGKTTVISAIIRRALARGERVLVVSPTHVAVDNVVEKLTARTARDILEPSSLPVRFSARTHKLSERALEYWVGAKRQRRFATIEARVEIRLVESVPFAATLFAMAGREAGTRGAISSAVASSETVICGTPIGILSCDRVRSAAAGTYDLLIVDEVSKQTLPEFLAVAVKARRWVLVGDPQQLPPHNGAEENASALDDLFDPTLELCCSIALLLDRLPVRARQAARVAALSSDPERVAPALRAHLGERLHLAPSSVVALNDGKAASIVLCLPSEVDRAMGLLTPPVADSKASVTVVCERGLRSPPREGERRLEERDRVQASIFSRSYDLYHSLPWSVESGRELKHIARSGSAMLPSQAVLDALAPDGVQDPLRQRAAVLTAAIAERVAVNMVSVYDWLMGLPDQFEMSPLRELRALARGSLCGDVAPFVGTLKKQYRMRPELSAVPRTLFYFDKALHDAEDAKTGGVVHLVAVKIDDNEEAESNKREAAEVCEILKKLARSAAREAEPPSFMVITPYGAQRDLLCAAVDGMRERTEIGALEVSVCTLDSCQGREADVVLISLVKPRATAFLDNPKRWNVALTRAKRALFIVGDVDAFLAEVRTRPGTRGNDVAARPPTTSLLAHIIDAYRRQLAASARTRPR